MAELADATVSNTVGEILTGSIPVPGTEREALYARVSLSFLKVLLLFGLAPSGRIHNYFNLSYGQC